MLTMRPTPVGCQNHLLAALPPPDYARISAELERVPLRLGDMLYEPGQRQSHAYFPLGAVVSLHYVMESGASAETAAVGNEGVVGVTLFMHGDSTASSAVVQIAGDAYRIPAAALAREFERAGPLQRLLLRYMQALIAQTTQTAVCNRHHSVEQQLCRWLLCILDRVPSGEVVVTQEMIAGVLGVRRESITEAAGALQRAGLIRGRRGHITVLERAGLEQAACECYAVVAAESFRLLPTLSRAAVSGPLRTAAADAVRSGTPRA
jgi:CRP-like cAMP-binding protein